ncbi:MAG TPA: transcriptional regulator [Saprospiraceae bacterium]|nr:transcriptional regulator [Saprospiraceae bacterium]
MKDFSIYDLDKAFESRVRLGIMSALMVESSFDFKQLKTLLGVTDGNLATHLKALEKKGYISVSKKFIGRKPNTSYSLTKAGRLAFQNHLAALEKLLGR